MRDYAAFSPVELRELARQIDGRYSALFDPGDLDSWADDFEEWASDSDSVQAYGGCRPALPEPAGEHVHRLLIAALHHLADDAGAMRQFLAD